MILFILYACVCSIIMLGYSNIIIENADKVDKSKAWSVKLLASLIAFVLLPYIIGEMIAMKYIQLDKQIEYTENEDEDNEE